MGWQKENEDSFSNENEQKLYMKPCQSEEVSHDPYHLAETQRQA